MKKKILITDDAAFMRMMLKNIFESNGYEVVGEATTGEQAIKKYEELHPDVVTMDITMPDMDGLTALKEIIKIDPNALVIMCSAVGQQSNVIKALKAGAKDFLNKPFETDQVLKAVENALKSAVTKHDKSSFKDELLANKTSETPVAPVSSGPALQSLEISPATGSLKAGETQKFTVSAKDSAGNSIAVMPDFSATSGKIGEDGVFTATTKGDVTITAKYASTSVQANINVQPGPAVDLVLSPSDIKLKAGDAQQFTVKAFDIYGNEATASPTFSATGGVITGNGLFTATTAGKTTISAVSGTLSTSINVEIEPGEIVGLTLTPNTASLNAGENLQLKVTAIDGVGNTIENIPVSLQAAGGDITTDGLFTAKKAGVGSITAKYKNLSAKADITVNPGSVAKIEVTPSSATIKAGDKQQFSAVGKDAFGNEIANITPTYNANIGTIDASGLYQAASAGSAIISVTASGISAAIPVTITAGAIASLQIEPTSISMQSGKTARFSVSSIDSAGNVITITPTFTASTGEIGSDGVFKATTAGTTTVKATVGDLTSIATVTVTPGEPAILEIAPSAAAIKVGEKITFKTIAKDAAGNIVPVTPKFSAISGSIEPDGTYTATRTGTGTVKALVGFLSAAATINIAEAEKKATQTAAAPTIEPTIAPLNETPSIQQNESPPSAQIHKKGCLGVLLVPIILTVGLATLLINVFN